MLALEAVAGGAHLGLDGLGVRVVADALHPAATVEVDDRDSPIGLEGLPEPREVGRPIFQMVVRVACEDEVDRPGREQGIVGLRLGLFGRGGLPRRSLFVGVLGALGIRRPGILLSPLRIFILSRKVCRERKHRYLKEKSVMEQIIQNCR